MAIALQVLQGIRNGIRRDAGAGRGEAATITAAWAAGVPAGAGPRLRRQRGGLPRVS